LCLVRDAWTHKHERMEGSWLLKVFLGKRLCNDILVAFQGLLYVSRSGRPIYCPAIGVMLLDRRTRRRGKINPTLSTLPGIVFFPSPSSEWPARQINKADSGASLTDENASETTGGPLSFDCSLQVALRYSTGALITATRRSVWPKSCPVGNNTRLLEPRG
jgi:hypothetical protein